MKVLVIGSGAREHAIIWKLSTSEKITKIYSAPGNAGTSGLAENINIPVNQIIKLLKFVHKNKIDLTVVGPEDPLIAGIVDLFHKFGLNIVGPSQKASQIEGSKIFAKNLMKKNKIPTANFEYFSDYKKAIKYLDSLKYPVVIKADGACLGKGVSVCNSKKDALEFLKLLMLEHKMGPAGNRVIIEERLIGQEVSFMVATDGDNFVSFLPSQDHKRAFDGDRGPNTGGIGAYTPIPYLDKNIIKKIESEIVNPTLKAMSDEGIPFTGILYPGLILTKNGPKVLEFNCRFGDPETQPVLSLLKTDLLKIFQAIISHKINGIKLNWYKEFAVNIVLTSKGYPGRYETGKIIKFNKKLQKGTAVFHSGTIRKENNIMTSGGRVLSVTTRGKTLKKAIENAYQEIGKNGISFPGMHFRKDIGKKGLNKNLWKTV